MVGDGEIQHVQTEDMIADIMTKPSIARHAADPTMMEIDVHLSTWPEQGARLPLWLSNVLQVPPAAKSMSKRCDDDR